MLRSHSTRVAGSGFDSATIQQVWNRGRVIAGFDPNQYRHDLCGAVMARSEYGQLSANGWEVDHILPVSRGGSDSLSNLQPLHWRNNRQKGDDYPHFTCAIP